jgi:hypothetical protein
MFVSAENLDLTKLLVNANQKKNSGDGFVLLADATLDSEYANLQSTIGDAIQNFPLSNFVSFAQLSQTINEKVAPGISVEKFGIIPIAENPAPDTLVNNLNTALNTEKGLHKVLADELNEISNVEKANAQGLKSGVNENVKIGLMSSDSVYIEMRSFNQLVSRVFPLGSVANGYLSYVHDNNSSPINISKIPSSISKTEVDGGTNLADKNIPLKLNASHLRQEFERIVNAQSVASSARRTQLVGTTTSEINTSFSMPSDIAKRFMLVTPNSDGLTLWFRDYDLDEHHKQDIKNRLINSEYAHENKINKVFINGQLLWQKVGGMEND